MLQRQKVAGQIGEADVSAQETALARTLPPGRECSGLQRRGSRFLMKVGGEGVAFSCGAIPPGLATADFQRESEETLHNPNLCNKGGGFCGEEDLIFTFRVRAASCVSGCVP